MPLTWWLRWDLTSAGGFLQVRKRKWTNYSSGEELFGLPVTQYEGLEQTEKEIAMLDRLYSCAPC